MGDITTAVEPTSGMLLSHRYRLDSPVASGGMATIYRATDQVLGREVAVKVMQPALASNPGFVERLRREAQNVARLYHPNIVTVHDWGIDGSTVFMVMELVDGASLRQLLGSRGALDVPTVHHIVAGVAAALDHAHSKGIVHRDVKPENVLLSKGPDDRTVVKMVDFGIARALGDDAARLTSDFVVGTMSYIAPEQLQGADVDGRADVYALGVMAFEMLTGRAPFEGDTPAAVAAARLARSVPSPGIGPRVDGAIAKATALRPADRFSTAGELAAALGSPEVAPGLRETIETPPLAVPTLPTQVVQRLARARRRRWPVALAAGLVLAALTGGGAWTLMRSVPVPRLLGSTTASANAVLERAGLHAGAIRQVFNDADAGIVVGSDPGPGEGARRGGRVGLTVSKGPDLLTLPHVVGKDRAAAERLVAEAGFVVGDVKDEYSAQVPAGSVSRQDPEEGRAKRGATITLSVSKGPELVRVPDVGGKSPDDATTALRGAGFGVSRTEDFSDTVAEGSVVRTNPAGGQQAAKGSTVGVVVSKGPKTFAMPNLVGMDRGEAKAKAQSLGLVVGNEYAVPGSGKPKGQVQGQNPAAGTDVRKGTRVDLYYAV